MATYYAWTNIRHNDGVIKVGKEVTADSIGVSKDEFKAYIESGAVRTVPYPDMGNFPGSPVELSKAQLQAAASGGYFDTQYGRVATEDVSEEDLTNTEEEPKKSFLGR